MAEFVRVTFFPFMFLKKQNAPKEMQKRVGEDYEATMDSFTGNAVIFADGETMCVTTAADLTATHCNILW